MLVGRIVFRGGRCGVAAQGVSTAGPVEPPVEQNALERFFKLSTWRTSVGTELMAGLTTFMVMAYIIFVNPTILTMTQKEASRAGITTATCLVAGLLCLAMGLYTNRALALAPGLGINAVVAFQLIGAQNLTYAEAMGVIVAEGIIITILVLTGLRQVV